MPSFASSHVQRSPRAAAMAAAVSWNTAARSGATPKSAQTLRVGEAGGRRLGVVDAKLDGNHLRAEGAQVGQHGVQETHRRPTAAARPSRGQTSPRSPPPTPPGAGHAPPGRPPSPGSTPGRSPAPAPATRHRCIRHGRARWRSRTRVMGCWGDRVIGDRNSARGYQTQSARRAFGSQRTSYHPITPSPHHPKSRCVPAPGRLRRSGRGGRGRCRCRWRRRRGSARPCSGRWPVPA